MRWWGAANDRHIYFFMRVVIDCCSMGLGPLPPYGGSGASTTPTSPAAPATPNPTQGTDTPASPGTETTAVSTPTTTTTTTAGSTTAGTGTAPSQTTNPQQDLFSQFMARMVCIYYICFHKLPLYCTLFKKCCQDLTLNLNY